MGIISRFSDIMASNINALLDKCEDPAKMVDQTLRKLEENLADVKKETAGVMAEEKRAHRELEKCKSDVAKWEDYAKKALGAGNEGDARQFLSKKATAEARQAEAQKVYDLAAGNADKMRQMHDKLSNDIASLRSRRETIKAKASVVKAQKAVNKTMAGANASGTISQFESMEARIDKQLDAAMAEAELNTEPTDVVDDLASKYDSGAHGAGVDSELERLKREMGLA